jgi:hypothetical protein
MFTFLFCYTYSHFYSVTHIEYYSHFLFCYTCSHFYSVTHIHIFILLHMFTFLFCYTYSHFYSVTHVHIFILLHMFTFLLFWYTCSLPLHPSINYHSYSLCIPYHPIKALLQFFSLFLGKKSILIIVFPGERKKKLQPSSDICINCLPVMIVGSEFLVQYLHTKPQTSAMNK